MAHLHDGKIKLMMVLNKFTVNNVNTPNKQFGFKFIDDNLLVFIIRL